MTQKYGDEGVVAGTVIISAGAEVSDVRKVVNPVIEKNRQTCLLYRLLVRRS
ncbi:hypothetical protein MASR1M31_08160 [Porphyromonadaceae bacterium]